MVDGDVVERFLHLSTADKQELARRLGASRSVFDKFGMLSQHLVHSHSFIADIISSMTFSMLNEWPTISEQRIQNRSPMYL